MSSGSSMLATGSELTPSTVSNVTLVEPLRFGVALTAQVKNLFDSRYSDPGSEEHLQDVIEQNGRAFLVGVRWRLGQSSPRQGRQ